MNDDFNKTYLLNLLGDEMDESKLNRGAYSPAFKDKVLADLNLIFSKLIDKVSEYPEELDADVKAMYFEIMAIMAKDLVCDCGRKHVVTLKSTNKRRNAC